MRKYKITEQGIGKLTLNVPEGRHEVTYDQWKDGYEYIKLAQSAKDDFDEGLYLEATKKSVESITHLMAHLCTGATYEQLKLVPYEKLNEIFILEFSWLSKEQPKKEFKIKERTFTMPEFLNKTAGDFMDVMDLIGQLNDKQDDAELGLTIAAIYMREGDYKQDLDKINERKDFLRKYAKMDVLYSAGFFLTNSLNNLDKSTLQLLAHQVEKELVRITSSLHAWATILYLQASQKVES